jgi:hypothetical protein
VIHGLVHDERHAAAHEQQHQQHQESPSVASKHRGDPIRPRRAGSTQILPKNAAPTYPRGSKAEAEYRGVQREVSQILKILKLLEPSRALVS